MFGSFRYIPFLPSLPKMEYEISSSLDEVVQNARVKFAQFSYDYDVTVVDLVQYGMLIALGMLFLFSGLTPLRQMKRLSLKPDSLLGVMRLPLFPQVSSLLCFLILGSDFVPSLRPVKSVLLSLLVLGTVLHLVLGHAGICRIDALLQRRREEEDYAKLTCSSTPLKVNEGHEELTGGATVTQGEGESTRAEN